MRDPVMCPCKGCEERTAECHARCKKYAAWAKRHKAWLEEVETEKYPEHYEYIADKHFRGRER